MNEQRATHPEALPGIQFRSPYPQEFKICDKISKVTISRGADNLLVQELDKHIMSGPRVVSDKM